MKKMRLTAFFILALLVTQKAASLSSFPVMPDRDSLLSGYCSRVVDGDTVYLEIVEDGIPVAHMYRLIGVDTPETVHPYLPVQPYGPEASAYTKSKLMNQWVYIEYDTEKTDRYERHLGYIWLSDGSLFNLSLLLEGYGEFLVIAPNVRYSSFLLAARNEAKAAKKGIWSPDHAVNVMMDVTGMATEDLLILQSKIEAELNRRTGP